MEPARAMDLAAACVLICAEGIDATASAVAAINTAATPASLPSQQHNRLFWDNGRAIIEGVHGIEMMQAGLADSIDFGVFDFPLLLAGLAAVLAPELPLQVILSPAAAGGGKVIRTQAGRLVDITMDGTALATRLCHGKPFAVPEMPMAKAFTIADDSFTMVEELARQTLVPESDHSRKTGAGAGSIDND